MANTVTTAPDNQYSCLVPRSENDLSKLRTGCLITSFIELNYFMRYLFLLCRNNILQFTVWTFIIASDCCHTLFGNRYSLSLGLLVYRQL